MDLLSAVRVYLESELAKTAREIRELSPFSELFAAELGELHAKHDAILLDIDVAIASQAKSRIRRES